MKNIGLELVLVDTFGSLAAISTPATPPTNQLRVYAKLSGGNTTLCIKNDAGNEICFPTSGSVISGSGTNNRVAVWTGTNSIGANAALTNHRIIVADSNGLLANNAALTTGQVVFPDSNGELIGDTTLTWDNTNKVLLVRGNVFPTIQASDFESNSNPPILILFKARGTIASPSGVASGDLLGDIRFQGRDSGGSTANGAILRATTSETWGGTNRGSFISFITTITGGTGSAERWRIEASSGQLQNIQAGNEATGAGSAALGANSPAITNTAPFTWIKFKTSDGSQVYIPCWK